MDFLGLGQTVEHLLNGRTPEEIDSWLKMKNFAAVDEVFDKWANSITWTQLAGLSEQYVYRMTERLEGSARKLLPPTRRTFFIEPTEKAQESEQKPKIGLGTLKNERRWKTIDGPMILGTDEGIYTARKYGPYALVEKNRGMLREITEEEYLQKVSELKKAKEAQNHGGSQKELNLTKKVK